MAYADAGAVPRAGREAVVLGGGMAGLLAAAALAEAFDRVTLVERDHLPADGRPRRGVPQGRHVHVLLSRGANAIEELLPGFLTELTRAGGVTVTNLSRLHLDFGGRVLSHAHSESDPTHMQTRPFLEGHVLRRVRALGNVSVLDGHDVVELTWDASGSRVVGAAVVPRAAPEQRRELGAELVVAAMGGNNRVGGWLAQRGYDEPPQKELRIDLMYVSRLVRMDPTLTRDWDGMVVSACPDRPTGVAALRQEDDTWILTVEGFAGHHPPTAPDAWLRMAEELAPPRCAPAIRGAEMLTHISAHRFPANLWRRYDKLARLPDGLVVTGDAVCTFNPVYGQGMTVAALEALALRDSLRQGTTDLPARFSKQASRTIRLAWQSAVGGDLSMPPEVVPGHRPLVLRVFNAYLDRYLDAAGHDAELTWHFLKVTGFDEPARVLFSPRAIAHIVMTSRDRAQEGPATAMR
jgi:2-polyprenyl-6-methoxyphenol hydroxylase-like FAD-dependent oxidoreductase